MMVPACPPPIEAFVRFAALLREHGFAIAPDQTQGFIEAIELLGPRSIDDVARAGRALFAIPREREPAYDALFRAFFLGEAVVTPAPAPADDEVEAFDPTGASREIEAIDEAGDPGQAAVATERLAQRTFAARSTSDTLDRFMKRAPAALPRRRSYRRARVRRGRTLDLVATLRRAARHDGELIDVRWLRRKTRQRRVVVLIDVSGSMQQISEQALTFAHALVQVGDRVEVFTLGTRLSRITAGLRARDLDDALAQVAAIVADFDGGTRLGDALQAFLDVPRFGSTARGALALVVSDGLERGDPSVFVDAVRRLKRRAWQLHWLNPLAADPAYAPRTEAFSAVQRELDALGDGASLDAMCAHVLAQAGRP
ncbi:MAG: VWA domain-containing protein [Pseudomonadota bacterium]